MTIMNGKEYRDELLEEYKNIIDKEKLQIRLDIILVGDDPASEVYVKNKLKAAEAVGINAVAHRLPSNSTTEKVISLIEKLNNDPVTTGIILQSPTPDSVDFDACASLIVPEKDVDGFTALNIDRLYHNDESLIPCTVKGIIRLLNHYGVDLEGKDVVIVGRGDIVGKPLALALTNRNATVTLCHSHTKDLGSHTKNADILISAVGKKDLIKEDMVKDGFIGVDVGILRVDGKLYGDFAFEEVAPHASLITPVPGGIGPMTVAMIMDNLITTKRKSLEQNNDFSPKQM